MRISMPIRVTAALAVVGLGCVFHPSGRALADSFGSGVNLFDIEFVTIGKPGNSADTTGNPNPAGAVDYEYRIGKYEISEEMVNKANAEGGLGITHDNRGANKPATSVSWFNAAKFVNWLNTTTGSTPAYKFDGSGNFQLWQPGDSGYDPNNLFRNTQARYFLPSVHEWYKAAYYDPISGNYFDFPTGSDTAPTAMASGTAAGSAIYNQLFQTGPADITQAGGLSPYGTMAQGGNAYEFQETEDDLVNNDPAPFAFRVSRGGGWNSNETGMRATFRGQAVAAVGEFGQGFRVASIAETVMPLSGDYNNDGKVDATDYVAWRKNPAGFGGDPAGYNTWRANFGMMAGAGSALGQMVPEPSTLSFFAAMVAGLFLCRAPQFRRIFANASRN
jgi:hypothetical protein